MQFSDQVMKNWPSEVDVLVWNLEKHYIFWHFRLNYCLFFIKNFIFFLRCLSLTKPCIVLIENSYQFIGGFVKMSNLFLIDHDKALKKEWNFKWFHGTLIKWSIRNNRFFGKQIISDNFMDNQLKEQTNQQKFQLISIELN